MKPTLTTIQRQSGDVQLSFTRLFSHVTYGREEFSVVAANREIPENVANSVVVEWKKNYDNKTCTGST